MTTLWKVTWEERPNRCPCKFCPGHDWVACENTAYDQKDADKIRDSLYDHTAERGIELRNVTVLSAEVGEWKEVW